MTLSVWVKKYGIICLVILVFLALGIYFLISYQDKKALTQFDTDFNSGNLDAAIKGADQLLAQNQNDLDALLALAATYAQKGSITFNESENAEKAIGYADRAIAIDANNSEAYRIKGYALEIQEKYAEAHQNYEKAIALNNKNSQAYSNNGHAYDLEGDIVKAEEWYKKAIEISPSNDHASLNLGRLYIRQESYESARTALDNVFSSSRNNRFKAEAFQLLAYISYIEEDFDNAILAINKALAIDPNMSVAWVTKAKLELGTALDMGTKEELDQLLVQVRLDIDKALVINPNQAEAYLVLSDLEIITGDKAKVSEYKNKALQAIPLDITLGKAEKEAMKRYIESQIKVTGSGTQEI